MKTTVTTGLAALIFCGLLQSAFAQDTAAPAPEKSRAAVKADTRASLRSGNLPDATDTTEGPAPSKRTTKTRAQRKAETRLAEKRGELTPAGEADMNIKPAPPSGPPRARSAVKAETRAAEKAGTIPRGESEVAPANAPK